MQGCGTGIVVCCGVMNRHSETAFTLRAPCPTDVPLLVALERTSFTTDRLNARRFHHWMQADNCHFEVASARSGEIAGYALVLYRHNSRRARLYSIAISPDCRGQGLAQQLLSRSEVAARRRGCDALYLEVRPDNHRAIHLYESAGYRQHSRITGFYEDGTDALRFEKALG